MLKNLRKIKLDLQPKFLNSPILPPEMGVRRPGKEKKEMVFLLRFPENIFLMVFYYWLRRIERDVDLGAACGSCDGKVQRKKEREAKKLKLISGLLLFPTSLDTKAHTMCNFVGPIQEFVKLIGRPAKRYLDYHRKFDKYVDDFKQARAELHAREADIKQQLQDEHRFGKKPKQEVENWFKIVAEKTSRAQGVEHKVSKGKYLFRSCLGKVVDETTQEIKEVYGKGQFSDGLVVNDPSTRKVKLPTEELWSATQVEEIYQYLMGDEVSKIGLCGDEGVGKTTIMEHVHNKLLEESKFSKVIWITVSQSFDIQRLQNAIACQLNEELLDDEDITIRAEKLSEMLRKQGRYVLILDDVWTNFSLKTVGIPEPKPDNGCKLVLTTQFEDVVQLMGCKKVEVILHQSMFSSTLNYQRFIIDVARINRNGVGKFLGQSVLGSAMAGR
ncbi:hypothetical protein PTKIN_Ptkin14bG0141100 [Pterospermum kingtungense]